MTTQAQRALLLLGGIPLTLGAFWIDWRVGLAALVAAAYADSRLRKQLFEEAVLTEADRKRLKVEQLAGHTTGAGCLLLLVAGALSLLALLRGSVPSGYAEWRVNAGFALASVFAFAVSALLTLRAGMIAAREGESRRYGRAERAAGLGALLFCAAVGAYIALLPMLG